MRGMATLAFGLVASGAPARAQGNTTLFTLGGLACSEIKLSNAADVLAVLNAAKADDPHAIDGGAPRWSSDRRRHASALTLKRTERVSENAIGAGRLASRSFCVRMRASFSTFRYRHGGPWRSPF